MMKYIKYLILSTVIDLHVRVFVEPYFDTCAVFDFGFLMKRETTLPYVAFCTFLSIIADKRVLSGFQKKQNRTDF